jgi:hypothetical protein
MDARRYRSAPAWSVALLLIASGGAVSAQAKAREPQMPAAVEETPESIARLLAGRHAFTELPTKGKVKHDIKMADQTFAMTDGPSRVALFKLPEFREAYVVTLKSYIYKRAFSQTQMIFVPITVVLDADFVVTRTVLENEFHWKSQTMMKSPRLEAVLPFADGQKGDRFVLVYTRASQVGHLVGFSGGGGPLESTNVSLAQKKSADGNLEVETGPAKKP